jgi:cellulose synthase operon protein C
VKQNSRRGPIIALVFAVLMAACSRESPEELLVEAKILMEKRDNKAAIIQLKNALQKNGSLAEARFLLGKALLLSGDLNGAEIELKKAREIGYESDELHLLISKILSSRGQADKVVEEYGKIVLKDVKAMAALQTTLAAAYAIQGKASDAQSAIDHALHLDAENVHTQLTKARLTAADLNGVPAALRALEGILAKAPRDSEAWQVKGEILMRSGAGRDAAISAFREAIKLDKNNVVAHNGLITLLLSQRNNAEITKALDAFRAVAPHSPQVKIFTVNQALLAGDLKAANEGVQALQKIAPEDPGVLYLAGLTAYQSGALLQAQTYLGKALTRMPNPIAARLLLAKSYVRSGETVKALSVLQPLLDSESQSAEVYSTAAEVLLLRGDLKSAEKYFSKAAALDPNDARSRTALAMAQMGKGQEQQGFDALRALSATDAAGVSDMALISAHYRRRQFDEAIKAIDVLERKRPGKPLAPNLRGRIELARGNAGQARSAFESALKMDPVFFPAAAQLAALDVADKNFDGAIKRFEKMLLTDPKNVQVQMAIFNIRRQSGASPAELQDLLTKIVSQSPAAEIPRAALVKILLDSGARQRALTVAQDGVAVSPNSAELFELLGLVQVAMNDGIQAAASFSKMASLQSNSPIPYVHLAGISIKSKDYKAAVQNYKRALSIDKNFLPALKGLFSLELATGNQNEAKAIIKDVFLFAPKSPVGFFLEGDFEANRGNWKKASESYRASLNARSATDTAIKLYHSLGLAGMRSDADAFREGWLKSHPRDIDFRFAVGDFHLTKKEYDQALTSYQEVLRIAADHPAANNNVAWLLKTLKRPGASAYAEKANQLRPNQAVFMDTLAEIRVSEGRVDEALALQEKALSLEPEIHMHRLHLAKYYVLAGKKKEAKAELDKLAKIGQGENFQSEVRSLLAQL